MKHVYIAEDDPTIAKLIRINLEKLEDIELSFFANGLDLYRKVQVSPPDAVITDIILPRLDGLSVVRLLKFNELYKHIPVMVISSVIDPDISEQVEKVRADQFLKKPFRAAVLRDKVLELLGVAAE